MEELELFEKVKIVRHKTDLGILDCKKALEENNEDIDEAIFWLRERGLKNVKKRDNKSTTEGKIITYVHTRDKVGVMLEMNCETDFVARTDEFIKLGQDLCLQIVASSPVCLSKDGMMNDDQRIFFLEEKSIINKQVADLNKPDNIANKIADGKMNKVYSDNCLLQQAFVKDPKMTVSDLVNTVKSKLGENIVVKRFERYELGE